jgi:6-phosphogluconolactonase
VARITIVESAALADAAAGRLTELIEQSIVARGHASVSLTGGDTPRSAYEALADPGRSWRGRIDWSRVHLFWGDERRVPPDDPQSNFGMAYRALVQHVPIPPAQVHRMRGELPDGEQAAAEYAAQLPEVFDVMLLGLGEDGHIASIFPGQGLAEGIRHGRTIKVRPTDIAAPGARSVPGKRSRPDLQGPAVTVTVTITTAPNGGSRITLTPPVILASRSIVMLVSGVEKAAAVAAAIDGPLNVDKCPAQLVRQADDRVEWIVDREAAAQMPG